MGSSGPPTRTSPSPTMPATFKGLLCKVKVHSEVGKAAPACHPTRSLLSTWSSSETDVLYRSAAPSPATGSPGLSSEAQAETASLATCSLPGEALDIYQVLELTKGSLERRGRLGP